MEEKKGFKTKKHKLDSFAFWVSISFCVIMWVLFFLFYEYVLSVGEGAICMLIYSYYSNPIFLILSSLLIFYIGFTHTYNNISNLEEKYQKNNYMIVIICISILSICYCLTEIYFMNKINNNVSCNPMFGCFDRSVDSDIVLVGFSFIYVALLLFDNYVLKKIKDDSSKKIVYTKETDKTK